MEKKSLEELRKEIDKVNEEILLLLSRRGEIAREIGFLKSEMGIPFFDPVRESQMLSNILAKNRGPFSNEVIKELFKEIFKASMGLIVENVNEELLVSRKRKEENTVIPVGDVLIGGGKPVLIAGPCSVESYQQMDEIASFLSKMGVKILRGGAYKPRTSPYSFQGLRKRGLEILKDIAQKYNMYIITEVMDPRHVDLVCQYAHILQIGTRNMHNYELLKEMGRVKCPVFLKRGFMSTLEEFLYSAEYILSRGNEKVILCERGIRTFERWTRNTLDISAIPILKKETHLPVIVDISHALGRSDITIPVGRASLAAGADGIMVEVHNNPSVALSDGPQQMDLKQFEIFIKEVGFFKTE